MNEVIKFENKEFGNVRTVIIDNEPWFVAVDVCNILDIKNNRDALSRLDEDEKDVVLTDTLGGRQQTSIINEYGLYSLTISSRKPEAKKFKRWITHEVIPSIRKTGYYSVNDQIAIKSTDISNLISITKEILEQNKKLISIIESNDLNKININKQIPQSQPQPQDVRSSTYGRLIESAKYPVNVTAIANDYGISAIKLNSILKAYGIQNKDCGYWSIADKYNGCNYTYTCTYTDKEGVQITSTKWTKKGRIFIYNLLKSKNILPICEKS